VEGKEKVNHTLRTLWIVLLFLLGLCGVVSAEESLLTQEQMDALSKISMYEPNTTLRQSARDLLDAEKRQGKKHSGGFSRGFGDFLKLGKKQNNNIKQIKRSAQNLVISAKASQPTFHSPAFKCLEEHYVCKVDGRIGDLGCGFGLMICWANQLVPLAGSGGK